MEEVPEKNKIAVMPRKKREIRRSKRKTQGEKAKGAARAAPPCILERARGGESLWRRGRAPLRRPSLVGQPGCRTAPRPSFPKTEENHRPMSLHLQGQSGT